MTMIPKRRAVQLVLVRVPIQHRIRLILSFVFVVQVFVQYIFVHGLLVLYGAGSLSLAFQSQYQSRLQEHCRHRHCNCHSYGQSSQSQSHQFRSSKSSSSSLLLLSPGRRHVSVSFISSQPANRRWTTMTRLALAASDNYSGNDTVTASDSSSSSSLSTQEVIELENDQIVEETLPTVTKTNTNLNSKVQPSINFFTTITKTTTATKSTVPNDSGSDSGSTSDSTANNNELLDAFGGAAKQAGTELFRFFRMSAAQVLTQSLPEPQRKELLNRVVPFSTTTSTPTSTDNSKPNPTDVTTATTSTKEKEQDRTSNTIDIDIDSTYTESVSEKISSIDLINYEQQQLKPSSNEGTSQQQELYRRLEQASTERVRNELAIQQELILLDGTTSTSTTTLTNISTNNTITTSTNQTGIVHPVLGKCIIDLGYKRLYTVSATVLGTIPVWQKQRTYRHSRAKSMANDKLKTQYFGLPGVILIHEDITDDYKLSILDGQHRVGMMQVLLSSQQQQEQQGNITSESTTTTETNKNDSLTSSTTIDLQNIVVEVYPTTSQLAQDLFLEVNKAEPVKLIDLPGVVTKKERTTITDAVLKLEQSYPLMFKPSQRCVRPHLNVDNVRDVIYASNIIKRNKLTTSKQLYEWLINQNSILRSKYNNNDISTGDTINTTTTISTTASEKAILKARKFDFYLGLENTWLNN